MNTSDIKNKARELGFDACGIARAGLLHGHQERFDHWLDRGFHGSMAYMERHRDKRLDPRELLPGARSVIVVAQNYYPTNILQSDDVQAQPGVSGRGHAGDPMQDDADAVQCGQTDRYPRVSAYAYGQDYHVVIKHKLKALIQTMEKLAPGTQSRGFTDSAPVLERAWAVQAGLGWTGKNACLIIPMRGSFFFLAEVITTLELEPDRPFLKDHCGRCTRCLEACPTKAIIAPGQIDARRCISYQTIENRGPIPQEIREKNPGWMFGCDICQEVCPHNRFAIPCQEPAFEPLHEINAWPAERWKALTKAEFHHLFVKGGSPIGRVTYEKLMENIRASGFQ